MHPTPRSVLVENPSLRLSARVAVIALAVAVSFLACGGAPPLPESGASVGTPVAAQGAPASVVAYRTYPMRPKFVGEERGEGAFGHTIRYFTDAERVTLTLHPCGGKLCDPQGKPLDPEVATHPDRSGTLLYAMTEDGTLYGTFDAKLHVIHHSSLNAGRPVACAGEMMLIEGEVIEVDNSSGHYAPPADALDQVVAQLRRLGVDLSRTKIGYYGLPDRQPPTN